MNRTDLQQLAEDRLADAEVLFQAGRWPAAYYLLGYAVECGLKACAAKQFQQDEVPNKTVVNTFYSHGLTELLRISGAKEALQTRAETDAAFRLNWNMVRDWSTASRYDHSTTEAKAGDLRIAVSDPETGVLPWLKTQW